ncbi:MAG: Ldh family oxidoreductase [Dehalococcoidia bacterium]|jgi:LDH2 family malate/lactate/ureidoglycolate dehydrogenase|nr:Ldh family oxidoreductase [Dehalococcoidia bacterium]
MSHVTTISGAETFMSDVLREFGLPPGHGRQLAEIVMDSELRGYPDHGLWFFCIGIVNWYRNGLNPDPDIRVVQDGPAITLMDAGGGIGTIGSAQAMDLCIKKASRVGIAAAGVSNSMNFVAAAPFVLRAAEAGMVGFICSNVPAMTPPTGGVTPSFGSNPMAYAVPAGDHFPVVVDFSTTATALAKVLVAKDAGEAIQPGSVMHPDGRPLTDADEFVLGESLMLPMAGAKGYGLMMMIDVLAGVLTGAGFGPGLTLGAGGVLAPDWETTRMGQFMWVLDPGQFMDRDVFLSRMDDQIEQIKNGERIEGVEEIFVPGERGLRRKSALLESGMVELADTAWSAMEAVAKDVGIGLPQVAT